MKIRFFAGALTACALGFLPLASQAAGMLGSDGVMRFALDTARTPVIECQPLFVTDIELQPGESILNIAIGDSVRWVISPAASGSFNSVPHIFIKPTAENLFTNLVITTSLRTYDIDLHSRAAGGIQRVAFTYPAVAIPNAAAATVGAAQRTVHDGAYRMTGAADLYPTHVWNDGAHTY